jgi:hypothetical protein
MSDEPRALRNIASLAVGSEQRARLVEAVAGEQELIDAQAVLVHSSTLKKLRRSATTGLLPEGVV